MGFGLNNTFISQPSLIPRATTGTYTGNGAASQTVSTAVAPSTVWITGFPAGVASLWGSCMRDSNGNTQAVRLAYLTVAVFGATTDIALNGGYNFVVRNDFNVAATTYYFTVLENGGSF